MAAKTAALTVNILANAANAKAGFKEAEKSAMSLKGQLGSLKDQMMGKLGVAAGFAAIGAFAMKAVGDFTQLAKKAADLGKATGLSTEQASRWIAVADDMGVTAESLQTAFKAINKDINADKWARYGVATKDASGQARKANDVLLDTLDVLRKIKDPTKRAQAGTELLGKAWGAMAPMVGKSRQEYERMLASVEAGQVITSAEFEKSEKMRLAQDALSDAWGELSLSVGQAVANMAPVLEGFAKALGVVGDAMNIIFGGDAASIDKQLAAASERMAAAGGNVQELAFSFDELAVATYNGASSWDKAVRGMDVLTGGLTTLGDSQEDVDRTRAALKTFNTVLESSAPNALAMAKALKEVAVAANDPNSPKWMREMDDAWNLEEDTIDGWITTAQRAVHENEQINAMIAEQTDLLDGLASEWEDYLGLFDIQETADRAKNALLELTYAIDDPTTATNEFAEAQKQAAEDVARFIQNAKDIPEDIQIKMLADLQSGDLAAVWAEIDEYQKNHPVTIPADVALNTTNFQQWMQQLKGIGGSVYSPLYGYGGIEGRRANGGPVASSASYLVGENGPELFTSTIPGTIVPNGAFGTNGAGAMSVIINMPAGSNGDDVVRALQEYARRKGQIPVAFSTKTVR